MFEFEFCVNFDNFQLLIFIIDKFDIKGIQMLNQKFFGLIWLCFLVLVLNVRKVIKGIQKKNKLGVIYFVDFCVYLVLWVFGDF